MLDKLAVKYKVEELVILETNIDDMQPEIYSYVQPLLLGLGALDVWLQQVVMKKGRPGVVLSVLCRPREAEPLLEAVVQETSSIGVRIYPVTRAAVPRDQHVVATRWGPVGVKAARLAGRPCNAKPEYSDCAKIAADRGVPLQAVMDEASTLWQQQQQQQ